VISVPTPPLVVIHAWVDDSAAIDVIGVLEPETIAYAPVDGT
jgi:hypothetical protein